MLFALIPICDRTHKLRRSGTLELTDLTKNFLIQTKGARKLNVGEVQNHNWFLYANTLRNFLS